MAEILARLELRRQPHLLPADSLEKLLAARLRFLRQVGLGYLHLNRVAGTLSAGEAQRISLAGLLGSGLTSPDRAAGRADPRPAPRRSGGAAPCPAAACATRATP